MSSFVRYAAVSGTTWAIDFCIFLLLYQIAGIPAALLMARIVAGIFAFTAHKIFSFSSRSTTKPAEVVGYIALVAINYLLSVVLISALPNDTLLSAGAAKLVVEVLIFAMNFLLLRRLFSPRSGAY